MTNVRYFSVVEWIRFLWMVDKVLPKGKTTEKLFPVNGNGLLFCPCFAAYRAIITVRGYGFPCRVLNVIVRRLFRSRFNNGMGELAEIRVLHFYLFHACRLSQPVKHGNSPKFQTDPLPGRS